MVTITSEAIWPKVSIVNSVISMQSFGRALFHRRATLPVVRFSTKKQGRISGRAASFQQHETRKTTSGQCYARETQARPPGAVFAPAERTEHKQCPQGRRLRKHRELQTGWCCFPFAKHPATGFAYPSVFADQGPQRVRPSTRPAGYSPEFLQSRPAVSFHRKGLLANDQQIPQAPRT